MVDDSAKTVLGCDIKYWPAKKLKVRKHSGRVHVLGNVLGFTHGGPTQPGLVKSLRGVIPTRRTQLLQSCNASARAPKEEADHERALGK